MLKAASSSDARNVIYTGSGGSYPDCVVASGAMNVQMAFTQSQL